MKKFLFLASLFLGTLFSKATHNRAGEILYKRIAPFTQVVGSSTVQVYTYSITVIKYTDHGPGVADRCVDTVYFGDGSRGVAPRINGATTCNCGSLNATTIGCGVLIITSPGYTVKYNVYNIVHTYPGPGSYLIQTSDPNRNSGVHNIPGSVNVPFYIESKMIISNGLGANSSPILSNPPSDKGIIGNCLYINPCAYDVDGDSLSYELSACRGISGMTISGYSFPETGTNGIFKMDSITGTLSWCTPQFVDQYNIAFIVKEWRKTGCNGSYSLIGYVLRDMQVLISGSATSILTSLPISDTCVKAGSSFVKTIQLSSSGLFANVYGETAGFITSPATISPAYFSGTTAVTYSWQTQCSQVRSKPYEVSLVYTNSTTLQKFYRSFKVKVLPPSPAMSTTLVDTGVVTLQWQSLSSCLPNLAGYTIYRKSGTNTWSPSSCQQGVTATSGFIQVGTAPANASSFTDLIFHPILNGTLVQYVVIAYTNDCAESIADNAQTISVLVGIKENKLSENIKIYPNPFKQDLEIDLANPYDKVETTLYSYDGKIVFISQNEKVQRILNLSLNSLKPGIYLLRIKTEKGVFYKKVIKE